MLRNLKENVLSKLLYVCTAVIYLLLILIILNVFNNPSIDTLISSFLIAVILICLLLFLRTGDGNDE